MDKLIAYAINMLIVNVGAVFAAIGLGMLHVPVAFAPRVYGSGLVLWGICIASVITKEHR